MTDRANQAAELAESLRAMRRNARNHWALQRDGRYSITMDTARLGDLTDAADLLEQQRQRIGELLDRVIAEQKKHIAEQERHAARQQRWIDGAEARLKDADLLDRMAAELAEWRSVFGHLGATPDDCGNAINSKRLDMQDETSRLSAALIPLANAAAPIEHEMLTDALYGKAGV